MDQLRDMYNMVHACEMANKAEKDIAIRRASGFNELYEAAMKKEAASASGVTHDQPSGSRSTANAKGKRRFGPEVEKLKQLTKGLIMQGGLASSKWTWGVDLTVDDLRSLIRGADRNFLLPHSGYDEDLISGPQQSNISEWLDPANLEDPDDLDICFGDLSGSIIMIPDLHPHQFPRYSEVQGLLEDDLTDPDPDPHSEAFTKGTEAAIKANKVLMQTEVDQPVANCDYGSEFLPRTALIPHRPWLMPHLPIILPPSNHDVAIRRADSDINDTIPHSGSSGSDMNSDIDFPESDDIPDHIDIPHSDDTSRSSSPSHAMDVVRSDEAEMPMSIGSTDSAPDSDDIVFPESPIAEGQSMGGPGLMVRDPQTGRFTAASFANFPDELLD